MPSLRFSIALAALTFALTQSSSLLAHSLASAAIAQSDAPAQVSRSEAITGTVHAVATDNAVRGTSSRYVELELDDGTLVPLEGDGSATLASGARAKVSGRHVGKRVDVESVETIAAPPAMPKSDVEVDGTLAVLHADDFVHGKSTFYYEVHPARENAKRLRLGTLPAALVPGMRVRISGHAEADGESITPDHITVFAEPTSATESSGAVAKAATINSVLVILANFNGTSVPAYGVAQAQQVMTTIGDSVANFFRQRRRRRRLFAGHRDRGVG